MHLPLPLCLSLLGLVPAAILALPIHPAPPSASLSVQKGKQKALETTGPSRHSERTSASPGGQTGKQLSRPVNLKNATHKQLASYHWRVADRLMGMVDKRLVLGEALPHYMSAVHHLKGGANQARREVIADRSRRLQEGNASRQQAREQQGQASGHLEPGDHQEGRGRTGEHQGGQGHTGERRQTDETSFDSSLKDGVGLAGGLINAHLSLGLTDLINKYKAAHIGLRTAHHTIAAIHHTAMHHGEKTARAVGKCLGSMCGGKGGMADEGAKRADDAGNRG